MTAAPRRRMGYYNVEPFGELPSVTTILKVIDKPALMNWAAKQAAKAVLMDPVKYDTPEKAAAAIYSISESAMARGSDAHKVAEVYADAYVQGKAFTNDNPYFLAIKAFFDTMRPEVIHKEVTLVNTKVGYAGAADLIARIGTKTFVVDYKTSKAVYPEYRLQVGAYRRCNLAILRDGSRLEYEEMADAGAVVLLKDDGSFTWTETTDDFEAFLAALVLFRWKEKTSW